MGIYKECDIRGKFGSELRTEHAAALGQALVLLRHPRQVLVGGDGRTSTPELKAELMDSLLQAGCDAVDLGMVPTPVFYFARQRLGIEVGVMVTASHNPKADNGFKVTLGPLPVTVEEMDGLARLMESGARAQADAPGQARAVDLLPEYIERVSLFAPDLRGMRVLLDCGSGMAGLVARKVWAKTGAQVELLFEEVDGEFPHHAPNPAEAKNLAALQESVRRNGADLGIAYDGDCDRIAVVDEQGSAVPSDKIIALFARRALRDGPAPIVYDQKCSRVVAETVAGSGGTPLMELSGHTFIKRRFLEAGAAYAGELSGHHFFRQIGGDDGILASLIFAGLVRESGKPVSALAGEIPTYPITPDIRIPVSPVSARRVFADLEGYFAGQARITRTDGLRIEFAEGWGLVRPSVTEPVITLRLESTTEAGLERLIAEMQAASPGLRGKFPDRRTGDSQGDEI